MKGKYYFTTNGCVIYAVSTHETKKLGGAVLRLLAFPREISPNNSKSVYSMTHTIVKTGKNSKKERKKKRTKYEEVGGGGRGGGR